MLFRSNINNLRYADDTTLMAESEEELKSLLMKVKEESEKVGLKLNLRPGAVAQSPGREAALAWASPAKRFPASSVLAQAGAGWSQL